MSDPITLDIDGDVARLTIQKPEKRNALTLDDLSLLSAHLTTAAKAPVRALVLTGAGDRAFSAGVDLSDVGSTEHWGENPLMLVCDQLQTFPRPTVARLNGAVIGGAAEISFACDFRVGVDGVRLMVPATRIGIHYEPAGLSRAIRCVGLQAAKRIYMLAEMSDTARLSDIGYFDRLADPGQLDQAVDDLLSAIRAGAPLAVDGMKQTFDELSRSALDEGAARARIIQSWGSEDMQEGLAAMREKRPAQFKGR